MTKVSIDINQLKSNQLKSPSDFDLLTSAMKDYLTTYQGRATFESQIEEMPKETKNALEKRLENEEGLYDLVSLSVANIPVRIHDNLYDLKSALQLLRKGNGVATDVHTGKYTFTYSDIQPDRHSKSRIEKLINEAQPTLDNNAPEPASANNNMPVAAVDSSLRSPSHSPVPQMPISEKSEDYQFYDGEDNLLEAKISEPDELLLPFLSGEPSLSFSSNASVGLYESMSFGNEDRDLRFAAEESMIDSDAEDNNLQSHPKQEAIHLKAVVVGAEASDKIGLLYRYSYGTYPAMLPTFMENEAALPLSIDDNEMFLSLWNVAGQEEYNRIRYLSYSDADVFILTYSVRDLDSFNEIETKWVPELRYFCPNAKIILVGCNRDLGANVVPQERISQVVHKIGAAAHIECSARTGDNVENVFLTAARIAFESAQNAQAEIAQQSNLSQQSNLFRLFSSLVDKVRGDGDESPAKHHEHTMYSTDDLVAELQDYISRRAKKGEQSVLSSLFGGTPMWTKIRAAQDVIDTLQGNPGSKPFSAYSKTTKETLLNEELGGIVNRYPEVAAQIKGEAQIAAVSTPSSSRGQPS